MSKDGCEKCGHPQEQVRDEFVQPHHYGCANKQGSSDDVRNARDAAPLCAKDGCTNEVPPSTGPRPAKYCPDHRTNRSKR